MHRFAIRPSAHFFAAVVLAGLWANCTVSDSSLGLSEHESSQQFQPQVLRVHAQPGANYTRWVFDPRRGSFTRGVGALEPTTIESLLMPNQSADGSVSGILSLDPLSVVELSSASLGDALHKHSNVSPMMSIAGCPSYVPDASFRLTSIASRLGTENALTGARISEHYAWIATNGGWSIQSAHCLREQPIAWEDTEAIRANLRQFTSDEAWLDVLVARVQSLQRHGVASLQRPKLPAWQIEAFLNNPKYVPTAEIRQVFERILYQIKVHSWESFVFHLSAAWQQFLSTVNPNDRIVIMRRLDLTDPTYSGNHLSRKAEIKSDDWVYGLIRDWTGQAYYVFDYARPAGYEGQWDGDALISVFTLRKWAKSRSFSGNVRFVYLDDWILSGNLAWGALSHAANFAQITDAFRMDVITAFQSDNPYHLNDYLVNWPYQEKLAIHHGSDVSTHVIPSLGSITTSEERALIFIDWMGPYSLGVIPYHRGDTFNNVHFWLDQSGAIHYSDSPSPGSRKVTLFDLLNLHVSNPPYR